MEWISTQQLVADTIALAGLAPQDAAGVCGIPRSGMLPASILATHLHLPLFELAGGEVRRLGNGGRGHNPGLHGPPNGTLLVVDDSIYLGGAIRRARAALGTRKAWYAALYAVPDYAGVADAVARMSPSPHLFEWNLFNNGPFGGFARDPIYGEGVASDLDGVLLHDEYSGGRAGTPYLPARGHPCKLIITGRREKHRVATEADLRRWGIKWVRLEMFPDSEPFGNEERWAAHKARHFAESGCGFFVESCPIQAELIWKAAGKPVICPRAGRVFH